MANLDPIIRALVGVNRNFLFIIGDIVNRLASKDGEQWRTRLAQVLQEGLGEVKQALLVLVASIPITPRTTKFVVADELSVGDHDGLKIAQWNGNFMEWFSDMVEEPTITTELVVSKLTRCVYDTEIVQGLGGDDKAKIAMSEFHVLLKKQGRGQEGDLRTDGPWSLAYIRDINGILRSVRANWGCHGWCLSADALGGLDGWHDDSRVVYRESR